MPELRTVTLAERETRRSHLSDLAVPPFELICPKVPRGLIIALLHCLESQPSGWYVVGAASLSIHDGNVTCAMYYHDLGI